MRTFISIALIIIGLAGIVVLYQGQDAPPAPVAPPTESQQPVEPIIREETITVAVAKEDLTEKAILTPEDFQLTTIKVPENSSEKTRFGMRGHNSIIGYALNSPIAKDSFIPQSALAAPGSAQYIELLKQPGTIIYTFILQRNDQYLLDNVKSGGFVDIYLTYDRNYRNVGNDEIISPGTKSNITDVRLKPIMMRKRVLSTGPQDDQKEINPVPNNLNNLQIIVELTDSDMKIIKALEGRSKFVLFPSLPEGFETPINPDLPPVELNWPVSDAVIFDSGMNGIREMRGSGGS